MQEHYCRNCNSLLIIEQVKVRKYGGYALYYCPGCGKKYVFDLKGLALGEVM
mgnify:CR=1 FL=1|jgi:RNase P subunit RPR2